MFMKKSIIFSIFTILFSFSLFSCIDYVQSVSVKDDTYKLYYKITLSKALFALMNENPESIFEDFLDSEETKDFPENIEMTKVDTDLEVGAEIKMAISSKTNDKDEQLFLPIIEKNKITIPFLAGYVFGELDFSEQDFNFNDKATIKAFFLSSKLHILISKNLISKPEVCYFEAKAGQHYSIPFFDYGENWGLEIPFIVFFEPEMYDFKNIIILQD